MNPRPWIALHQPDQPGNLGAVLRLGACFELAVHVIEPCGFPLDHRRIKRAGMDYIDKVEWSRHASFDAFLDHARAQRRRLVLLSAGAATPHHRFAYRLDDALLLGSESRGVPDEVAGAADARLRIPLAKGMRSLNVATAAALAAGAALAHLDAFPNDGVHQGRTSNPASTEA